MYNVRTDVTQKGKQAHLQVSMSRAVPISNLFFSYPEELGMRQNRWYHLGPVEPEQIIVHLACHKTQRQRLDSDSVFGKREKSSLTTADQKTLEASVEVGSLDTPWEMSAKATRRFWSPPATLELPSSTKHST